MRITGSSPKLESEIFHTDEHIDNLLDAKTLRVIAIELFAAGLTKHTLDRLEAIAYGVVFQFIIILTSLLNICQDGRLILMLVNVRSERLLELV